MELYKVIVQDPAEADLRNISAYLVYELEAPAAAEKLLDAFDEVVERLSRMPELYSPILELSSYRKASIKNYLVFHSVDNMNRTVHIERVLHSSQNWLDILQSEESPCLITP